MSRRALWASVFALGLACSSLRAPARTRYWAGVGDCPPATLTNACREREWSLLREAPQAAADELRVACDDGQASPCLELGLLLTFWRNLPHDEREGREAFSSACDLRVPEACALEALMLETGRGGPRQLDRASDRYQRACALGERKSCVEHQRLVESTERPGELDERTCTEPCNGGLGKEAIHRVMRRRAGSVRYCYVLLLEREPLLEASLAVRFVIDAAGHVSAIEVTGTTDEPLAACVSEALSDFQFPRPSKGGTVNVTFPWRFVFTSADAGS